MEVQEIISSGILEAYVMGISSPTENLEVLQWVNKYPEIKAEIEAIEKSMRSYALSQSIKPSAGLKNTIEQQLGFNNNATEQTILKPIAKVASMSPLWRRLAVAASLLLIGSALFNVVYYNKYKNASLAYNDASQELVAKNEQLNMLNKDMSVVQNKYSVPVSLNGLEKAPEAAAKIFWMKNTGEVYIDPSNLPTAPEGKQYQLWAMVDGKPIDAGMILSGKDGKQYHIQKMKTFGKVDAFAVTLEDTGGHPAPQGDMYVMGKL